MSEFLTCVGAACHGYERVRMKLIGRVREVWVWDDDQARPILGSWGINRAMVRETRFDCVKTRIIFSLTWSNYIDISPIWGTIRGWRLTVDKILRVGIWGPDDNSVLWLCTEVHSVAPRGTSKDSGMEPCCCWCSCSLSVGLLLTWHQ